MNVLSGRVHLLSRLKTKFRSDSLCCRSEMTANYLGPIICHRWRISCLRADAAGRLFPPCAIRRRTTHEWLARSGTMDRNVGLFLLLLKRVCGSNLEWLPLWMQLCGSIRIFAECGRLRASINRLTKTTTCLAALSHLLRGGGGEMMMTFQPNSRVLASLWCKVFPLGERLAGANGGVWKLACCVLLSGRRARSKWPLSSFSPKHESIEELVNEERERAF